MLTTLLNFNNFGKIANSKLPQLVGHIRMVPSIDPKV